jgi:diguanylate cyclase (GGDEF)-like protein
VVTLEAELKATLAEALGVPTAVLEDVDEGVVEVALGTVADLAQRVFELEQLAECDELTGAMRRGAGLRAIDREAKRAWRSNVPMVVAFIDVDGLKRVNDEQGHAAGDRLLREVSQTVASCLRCYDVVARYGGDEFVCALPGLVLEEAMVRFGEVRAALAATPSRAQITVGLVELEAGETVEAALERADA